MKYIKTYESKCSKFKVGEYVKLINMSFNDEDTFEFVNIPDKGKIIKIKDDRYFLLVENGQIMEYNIFNILRKMTIKEIEDFELNISKNKYNI
jgi:hypothetical protein